MDNQPTLGVEEEFFTLDRSTHELVDARPLLTAAETAAYTDELRTCMVESRTGVCQDLAGLRADLRARRQGLIRAGQGLGTAIVSASTFPTADWRRIGYVPKPRFEHIATTFARLADEHLVCGCHVHVGVADRDTAVEVMNRARPWLPVLTALSASSPFWLNEDTGYASYRCMIWDRWPMAGIPPVFRSYDDYQASAGQLIASGGSADTGQVFWEVRPATRYPTVEFRIADACATVDETVLLAALCRGLVGRCLAEADRGDPVPQARQELLRMARWRAARFGLTGTLVDPVSADVVDAEAMLGRLLDHVREPLTEYGDWDEVTRLVAQIKTRGTSAERQRRAHARRERLDDVIDLLVRETAEEEYGGP